MNTWDITPLTTNVTYRIVEDDGAIQSILFENEPYQGKPTEVFAYLGVPKGQGKTVPGMVCLHGGGGTAFKEWVALWNQRGYAAIAIDFGGRGGDGNRLPNGGPEQDHEAKFSTTAPWEDMWTYHAISAVIRANTLLRSLPSVDAARIGITGISWGGYLTCIAAGLDPRFACAIPVYGCGFLQRNSADVWMTIFAEMTPEQRATWHARCDPSMYLPQATAPMLFVSGTNDFAYPLDSLEQSCALPKGPVTRCVRRAMPHSHQDGWAPAEIHLFTEQHLNKGEPLPTILPSVQADDTLRSEFRSVRPVRQAYLLYTTDRTKQLDREWHQTPAIINQGSIEATLPPNVSACFLALEDDRGAYVSSPYREF